MILKDCQWINVKGTVSGHYEKKKVIQLVLLIWQIGILLIFERMQNDSIFRFYKCVKPSCCPVSSKK